MHEPAPHPWVGRRVLARTPAHYRGIPTHKDLLANIPRIEAGVITSVAETAFGETIYVLIDDKQRPEPFTWAAIEILPKREGTDADGRDPTAS